MSSNFSVQELITYKFDSMRKEQLRSAIETLQDEIASLQKDVAHHRKSSELIDEQVFFARELVESILVCVKQAPRAKELKAMILVQVSDSSFEL